MRALAADTERALRRPIEQLGLPWSLATRTGDSSSAQRARQARRLPTALVTTPESLSVLLSQPDAKTRFASLKMLVVDEWHELLGNKRGVQLQLALARLRRWQPALITWGLSATIGNLQHALEVLVPDRPGRLVQAQQSKELQVDSVLPDRLERFPWAGHLGLSLLPKVVQELEKSASSLIFTNTRAQSELWYQALLENRPDWAGLLALHHGSLDRKLRDWVETAVSEGKLKAVICTSSLDLGVDFLPVERVFQIGSPKGIARLMQRAGRSGHAPGRTSRISVVPTHALELLESIAAQDALKDGQIEPRMGPDAPMDVLVQHLVTVALGGGFTADELFSEIRSAYAYRGLTERAWQWALGFIRDGGSALTAYPDYRRAIPDENGVWQVPDAELARRHRSAIGTIVSDAQMTLKFSSGKSLGQVEENFIARMKVGEQFQFAGRVLELTRVHQMTAYVKLAKAKKALVPRWSGGRAPLTSELAFAVKRRLDAAAEGKFGGPEMTLLKPLLMLQRQWSALPSPGMLLGEVLRSREGWHLYLYPFAGRNVHLGLASLLAWRLGNNHPSSFSIAVNDYGFELLSAAPIDWENQITAELFEERNLAAEVSASLNSTELAQRRFREIARIAGLVFSGSSYAPKSTKQLQASSRLFYEVFSNYDSENLLLAQARAEVLQQELELTRLRACLDKMRAADLQLTHIQRPTPFAFPLLVARVRESSSSESITDRINRMVAELEQAAG